MRILIDTNIFIYRETYKTIPKELGELLKILNNQSSITLLVHPLSKEELKNDKNVARKNIALSKIKTYLNLKKPPQLDLKSKYYSIINLPKNSNDRIDDNLLFCVYKDAIDFLLTQDNGIHTKASNLDLSDRIFNISEALVYFKKMFSEKSLNTTPTYIKRKPMYNINTSDPFFNKLKCEYKGFLNWWKRKSREGKFAWVYYKPNKNLGGLLILKKENEAIEATPFLTKKNRLKISTLQVTYNGYKLGELFIKIAINYAKKNNLKEIYLTHFTKENDRLLNLINKYGFFKKADKKNGEEIFLKKILPDKYPNQLINISDKYYPCFYDGKKVKKFITPIKPKYYNRLFPEKKLQLPLFNSIIVEGNTIKKAYILNKKLNKISPYDIILFYQSRKEQKILTLGVIENVYTNVKDSTDILRIVGKRTVFIKEELQDISKKQNTIILFKWHLHFNKKNLSYNYLLKNSILNGAPQSTLEIEHYKYKKIKKEGEIDERFTFN